MNNDQKKVAAYMSEGCSDRAKEIGAALHQKAIALGLYQSFAAWKPTLNNGAYNFDQFDFSDIETDLNIYIYLGRNQDDEVSQCSFLVAEQDLVNTQGHGRAYWLDQLYRDDFCHYAYIVDYENQQTHFYSEMDQEVLVEWRSSKETNFEG